MVVLVVMLLVELVLLYRKSLAKVVRKFDAMDVSRQVTFVKTVHMRRISMMRSKLFKMARMILMMIVTAE